MTNDKLGKIQKFGYKFYGWHPGQGFHFGDNKVPKYLTDQNGIAEIHLKVQR